MRRNDVRESCSFQHPIFSKMEKDFNVVWVGAILVFAFA